MRSHDPQRGNEEARRGRIMGGAVSHMPKQMGSELQVRSLVTWTASIHCKRCRGLMYRIQLQDWGGSRGQDGCDALQCITCGDIIDPVIVKNRRGSEPSSMVRRKIREGRPRVALAL